MRLYGRREGWKDGSVAGDLCGEEEVARGGGKLGVGQNATDGA